METGVPHSSCEAGSPSLPADGAPVANLVPAPAVPAPASAWWLVALYPLLVVFPATIGVAVSGPRAPQGGSLLGPLIGASIGTQIGFLILALVWARLSGLRTLPLLRITRPSWASLFLGVGTAFAAVLAGYGLTNLLLFFLGIADQGGQSPLAPFASKDLDPWLRFALLSILPGLCEEISFRGALQTALLRSRSPARAIAIGAVIFATIHLDLAHFPARLVAGLALGWLVWRTGSIWPGVVAHALVNGPAGRVLVALFGPAVRLQTAASSGVAMAGGLVLFALLALAARRWLPPAPEAATFLIPRVTAPVGAETPAASAAGPSASS